LLPRKQSGWQAPSTHPFPLGQTLPHAPQLSRLLESTTHIWLQFVSPSAQPIGPLFVLQPPIASAAITTINRKLIGIVPMATSE
jgi:hypothetical protein